MMNGRIVPDQSGLRHSNSTADSLYGGTTDIYSLSDEIYISSEAECSGTGQYCIRSIPRSPSTGPPSTPSTEAHSDKTFSSTQASFLTKAPHTIPTDFLTEPDTGDSDMDSVLSRDYDEDTQTLIQSVSRGRLFPTWYFDTVSPKFVKKIPDDIVGTKLYMVHICEHLWHVPTSDRRHFRMLTSSRKGFMGERCIGTCKGSFVCNNKACPFIRTSQFQQPNKVSWRNIRGNLNFKVCAICDHVAQCIYCGAKKLVEYDYIT